MEMHKRTVFAHIASLTLATGVLFSGAVNAAVAGTAAGAGLLPANARPGECYAKVMVPAVYKTVKEKMVVAEAGEKIKIIPAKYEWTEVRVPVQQGSEKLIVVPATYKTIKEKIEISPARTVWRLGPGEKAKQVGDRDLAGALSLGLPVKAQAGQCFNEFFRPARFETKEEKLLKTAAAEKITTTSPQFKWVEEKVLVKEAAFKIVEVPAVYETVNEKVLASPAYTTWKKGRGLNEQVDNATGEIMCLVEVPAKYTMLEKRVLKKPATVKKVDIPAVYKTVKVQKLVKSSVEKRTPIKAEYQTVSRRVQVGDALLSWNPAGTAGDGKATGRTYCLAAVPAKHKTISKRVIKDAASVKKVAVPATYKNVRMRKLVSKATEKRTPIPAKYKIVPKHSKVSAAQQEWRPVLCETNTTRELVLQIQNGLKKAGFNPGTIDGVLGSGTMKAADAYQRKHSLPTGGLTIQTIEKLGIKIGG